MRCCEGLLRRRDGAGRDFTGSSSLTCEPHVMSWNLASTGHAKSPKIALFSTGDVMMCIHEALLWRRSGVYTPLAPRGALSPGTLDFETSARPLPSSNSGWRGRFAHMHGASFLGC